MRRMHGTQRSGGPGHSRGQVLRSRLAGVLALSVIGTFVVPAVLAAPAGAATSCGSTGVLSSLAATCTYSTVGTDTYTVPTGTSQVIFDTYGAQGGGGSNNGSGGVYSSNITGSGGPGRQQPGQ